MIRLALASALLTSPATAEPLRDAVAADMPSLMPIYRDLHANPELSFEETRTASKLAGEFRKLGFAVTEKVGKTGVVAVLRNGTGATVMLRADMDALPVEEKTGLPYASSAKGRMHACGHDTHMTALIGAARRLAATKGTWSGTLVLIAQPAEEIGLGAKAMIDDGLFTRFPKPSHVLGFHDSASLPAGVIGLRAGYALASVDTVDLTVRGVGGHGASPHTTRDPIVLAARIVGALQTLVSRELDPQDAAVVTVGSFQAGSKHNIIPDEAMLQLTVRSYSDATRKLLLDGIIRIARGEAIAAGMPEARMPVLKVQEPSTPATFNTTSLNARLTTLFGERFGKARVAEVPAVMVGEDFSRYWLADRTMESALFWVGGVRREAWDQSGGDVTKLPSLHSASWSPDAETVISTAAEAMSAAALDLLARP